MVLPEIGTRGQQAFSEADVVIIGLGALGCVSADLLVRAGVGRVRLVDRDVVEMVNLQRQTLYSELDVDRPKAEAAAERLRRVNSSIRIDAVPRDVHSGTVTDIVEGASLIVDGTDNFETRFLLNEAALDRGMPFIYGGAIATYGMVLAIRSPDTACFRCFNPKALPPGSLPTCETAGIFNPVSAQVGALQAAEALRLLLGENPSGDLLVVDGWRPEIQRIHIARGTHCPACVGGDREYIGVRRTQVLASLCGSDTISLDPNHKDLIDLEGLRIRLEGLGQARRAAGVLVADVEGRRLTVFPDGRALIRGVRNESEARAVYAKYIGV
jgi:molybdopterin-synthase adenylyltransferase